MAINYAKNDYGDVEFEGRRIHLTQMAYPGESGTRYYAHGVDDSGGEWRVEWETTAAWDAEQAAFRADFENFEPSIPEDEACDWSYPVAIRAV